MPKTLTLVPQGGLCNRMRVITSMLELIPHLPPTDIHIAWIIDKDCGAAFEDLFQPLSISNVMFVRPALRHHVARKTNLGWPYLLRTLYYNRQLLNYNYKSGPLSDWVARYKHVFLSTCLELAPYEEARATCYFRPTSDLQQRIDNYTMKFDDRTIGIHIRRTDNLPAMENSPLVVFEQQMDDMITACPQVSFFLASDDDQTKQRLREKYGERILTRNVVLTRKNKKGMEEAVIDLWCLARTAKILGSYYSSYSQTAAELGGIPLQIISKKH